MSCAARNSCRICALQQLADLLQQPRVDHRLAAGVDARVERLALEVDRQVQHAVRPVAERMLVAHAGRAAPRPARNGRPCDSRGASART